MAKSGEMKTKTGKRTMADLIVFTCIAVWGAAAAGLSVLAEPSPAVLGIGIGVGCATILVAALGFWLRSAAGALLGAAALLSLGFIGSAPIATEGGILLAAGGAIGLIMTGCSAAIVGQVGRLRTGSSAGTTPALRSGASHIEQLLAQIYENSMLSDNAKRVIFREREIAMLREAIEHDIAKGDYGAALALCDDIANLFGQRETAEKFRQEIEHARREHYEAEIAQSVQRLDGHLRQRDWAKVHEEAARIRRLYPDSHVLHEIDHRIEAARMEHKKDLESRFLQAAQHEDVEQAMDLLRELDRYLTQDEAEQYREVAQGVVSKHRDNLGVQFKLAVNDHRWAEAAQIGETIMNEFPNTKMANEVRSMIDLIRTRATQAAVSAQE